MSMAIAAGLVTIAVQAIVLLARLSTIGGASSGERVATPVTWTLAALPIVAAHTFELLTQNFDMISVSYFLGAETTGIYFAALKTIAPLAFVNFAVGAAIATSASFVALALSVFYVACRRLGVSMFPTVPWSTLARVFPKLAGTHRA
jgi:O-antigen/teichoic acid export membrane protein